MAHCKLGSINNVIKSLFSKPLFLMTYLIPILLKKEKRKRKKNKRDILSRPLFVHSEPWDSIINKLYLMIY